MGALKGTFKGNLKLSLERDPLRVPSKGILEKSSLFKDPVKNTLKGMALEYTTSGKPKNPQPGIAFKNRCERLYRPCSHYGSVKLLVDAQLYEEPQVIAFKSPPIHLQAKQQRHGMSLVYVSPSRAVPEPRCCRHHACQTPMSQHIRHPI